MEELCTLVILVTSDIHGNVYPIQYGNNEQSGTGLAMLAPLLKKEASQADCSLLIDNGDLLQGTPLTYHFANYQSERKNPLISILNYLRYDAAVIGNHEFNYGKRLLEQAITESNFPWLSANILESTAGKPAFGPPYVIKEFANGLKVAVLGVTTHYIPNWENPAHIHGLDFTDAFSTTKKWVELLQRKEEFDILVVSYHGGLEKDLITGEPTEPSTGENQAFRMCEEIPAIDILLTGHQHRQLAGELNGVTILQPGFNGKSFGKATVSFSYEHGKWTLQKKKAEILETTDNSTTDEAILAIAYEYETETQKWLDQPIGEVIGDMTVKSAMDVRTQDHPLIEFINKVQMDASGVDISSTALFHNGSPGLRHKVTMRDIVSNYIYPNTLKVIRITGEDIKAALEKSASYFILNKNGRLEINPAFEKPKPQHYNYDMWEGIEYTFDISMPVGNRVIQLEYHGKPIDPLSEYDVVMNNYRAGGGGNFTMFKGKPVIKEIPTDMTELLANYFLQNEKIDASCNHNWRIVQNANYF